MDSFTINKIAGAVLGTLTVLLGVNVLVEEVFHQEKPKKPGYEIAEKKEGAGGGEKAAAPAGAVALLAKADPAKGEQAVKKCAACHSFGKGEPHKVGPNLYGIVGLKHGHEEDFGYSDAMKKSGGNWDFASLDKWLENPKGYIAGTSMSFPGVKAPEERANIIAYLNKNSDKPQDLPKAGEGGAPAAGGDKKPEGGAAGGGGDFAAKVAAADPTKGQQVSKKCAACHSFGKGEPAKVGPNLYGILGLKHAHMEGFNYSDAMKKTTDKVWDVDNLSHWLENPKGYIAGTTMAFPGIKNEDERANLIAYLNKNSDKPVDLKAGGGGDDKKAEGGAPAGEKKPEGAAPAPAAPPAGDKKPDGAAPAPAAPAEDKKTEAAPAAPAEEKKAEAAKPAEPAKPAEEAKPAEPAKPADQAAAPAAGGEIHKLIASADPANGEKVAQEQCAACHTFNKGGEAGAGPNLYGIVGAKHAHIDGFEYSDEFKAHTQGPWDFKLLDEWLKDPAKVVQGTMMAFPGIEDAKQRADVIAYLNKNSDNPAPIPGK